MDLSFLQVRSLHNGLNYGIMSINEFEKAKIFSFNDSVEYSDGGIVSKTVLKKETGNISLFSFAKGEALSEHTAGIPHAVKAPEKFKMVLTMIRSK